MGRSKSAKRELRRLQKLKKRKRFRHMLTSKSSCTRPADVIPEVTHDPETISTPNEESSDDDCFGSPGSPPPTPVPSEPDPPSVHTVRQGIKDQCTIRSLQEKLYQSGHQVNRYRNQVKQQEDNNYYYIRALHRKEKDFARRVRYVRHFWCEKIYSERTRSGKIVKAAMQGRTINE